MQILIRTKSFPITEAIENHINNRIHFMLSRFSNTIRKVEIFIADENGPKGGIDKLCIAKIKTDHHSDVVVKDIEADLYTAISRALARARQSLTRHIQQARRLERGRAREKQQEILNSTEQMFTEH